MYGLQKKDKTPNITNINKLSLLKNFEILKYITINEYKYSITKELTKFTYSYKFLHINYKVLITINKENIMKIKN